MTKRHKNGLDPADLSNNRDKNQIRLIIIDREQRKVHAGGDVHIETLTEIYEKDFGIEVVRHAVSFPFKQFNGFSNIITLVVASFSPINKNYKEFYSGSIVVAPNPYPLYVITALRISKSVNGYPVVYFHHLSLSLKFLIRRGIFRSLINYFLQMFTLSACKILGIPIFLDHAKLYSIKGIDVFEDDDAPDRSIKSEGVIVKKEFDICYVGRFQRHKGAIDIIKVANILKNRNIFVKVAIVGYVDERFKSTILKILRKKGLDDNFIFFGTVNNEAKLKVLMSSRIYVHLSYEEGWSMSVMDAAYIGIPIVAYDLQAYSYLQGKYTSIPLGDTSGVALAIEKTISNYSDAIALANEARAIVSAYNYPDIAKYQVKSYSEIIKKGMNR